MRWASFVDIVEHPALLTIEVVTHECSGNGMATGNIRTLGVAKSGVTGLQFAQQILNLLLELFVTATSQDLILPGFGQFFPIRPVHTGIEMLSRDKLTHPRINLLFRLRVETHWPPKSIGDPPSPTKRKAPQ